MDLSLRPDRDLTANPPSDPAVTESAYGTVSVASQGGDPFAPGRGNSVYLPIDNATGHATQVRLLQAANGGQGAAGRTGGETSMILPRDASHDVEIFIDGGQIAAMVNAGSGGTTVPGAVTYNAANMARLRLRESGGALRFSRAPRVRPRPARGRHRPRSPIRAP